MTAEETPASSNNDETTQAQTTTEALEWHAPVLVRIDEHTTIPHLLKERVQRGATRPLILRKIGIGDTWRSITAREFYDEVHALAAGLIARGLEPGDRVAIMSRTRYEWTLLDFACWAAGLVPVPIYETSSIDQVAHVLVDADVNLIITETVSMAEIVRAAAERENRANTHVLSLDSEAIETLIADGSATSRERVLARSDALTKDDIATIVYTSGTTGTPKGTVLSHGNFTNLCVNAHRWMPEIAMGTRLAAPALPAAGPRLRALPGGLPDHRQRRHRPRPRHEEPPVRPGHPSARPTCWWCRGSWRRSTTPPTPRPGPAPARRCSAGRPRSPSTTPAPWTPRTGRRAPCGPSGPLADRLVFQQSPGPRGRQARLHRLRRRRPWASGSRTSTAALGIPVLEGYGLTETVGPVSRQHAPAVQDRHRGPAPARPWPRVGDDGEILVKGSASSRATTTTPRPRPRPSPRRLVPHRRPRLPGPRRLRADHGPREGHHRDRRRQERRPGHPGGPAARAPARRPGTRRRRQAALHRRTHHAGRGDAARWLRNHGLPPDDRRSRPPRTRRSWPPWKRRWPGPTRTSRGRSRSARITVLTSDFTEANGLLTPSLKVKRAVEVTRASRPYRRALRRPGAATDANATDAHMNEAVAGSRSPAQCRGWRAGHGFCGWATYCEASAAVGGVRAARIAG